MFCFGLFARVNSGNENNDKKHVLTHLYFQEEENKTKTKQTQGNISIHLESCLRQPDECKSNIQSLFSFVFGLLQFLKEISGSLAAKGYTMFSS